MSGFCALNMMELAESLNWVSLGASVVFLLTCNNIKPHNDATFFEEILDI